MVGDQNKESLDNDELAPSNSWELEVPGDSVDDRIAFLTRITQNRLEAREIVKGTIGKEQGSGDLETDLGYIQVQPPRKELIGLIHMLKHVKKEYPGHIYRDIALIETVIIGFGLDILDGMLKGRTERMTKEYEDWKAGKTPFTIEPYHWQVLKPVEKGRDNYTVNYYLLNQRYRARIGNIKEEYSLPLGLVTEMCIVEAARTSKKIPLWLKEQLDKEHERFVEWLTKKDQIDMTPENADINETD
jgi:hypothetical protein